jgi:hypothetical protein
MLKRRTLALYVALAIVAIGVGIYLCLPRMPQFTEEQFDRIQIGMTQAEVETVLGCPPGGHIPKDLIDRLPEPDTEPSGKPSSVGRRRSEPDPYTTGARWTRSHFGFGLTTTDE